MTPNNEIARPAANSEEDAPVPRRPVWKLPPGARCASCGDADIVSLPTYSVGSGLNLRPFAEDVLCRKCGVIAPVAFTVSP